MPPKDQETNALKDYASYQTYQEGFFLNKEAQGNTLISAMTPLQYLDAISCPRVDPSNMGKKIMSTNDWSDDIPSTDDEDEAVTEEPSTQASNK